MHRRRFVTAIGATSLAAIAGCLGDDGGTPGSDGSDDGDGHNHGTPSDDSLADPEEYAFPAPDEPADPPEDLFCAVCNMTPADYPEANAQAVHDDGSRQFFCSPGCYVSYHALPNSFDAPGPVEHAWVRDFESRELVAVEALSFVLNTLPERGIDPMRNPVPFTDGAAATAYVDEFDDLEESDIIETAEIDRGVAELYREFYFDRNG